MLFLQLHCIAVCMHMGCLLYAVLSDTSNAYMNVQTSRVDFTNLTEASPYYSRIETYNHPFLSVTALHGIVALITVMFHAFVYFPIHYAYATVVWKQEFFALRWLEYSLTCTLMTIASAISNGTRDLNFVIVLFVSGIVLQGFGLVIEQSKTQWRFFFVMGSGLELSVSWNTIWYTVTSSKQSTIQILETLAFIFFYSLFALNCITDAVYRKGCFIRTDWIYNLLSLTSKFALFWIQVGDLQRVFDDSMWPTFQIYGLGIILPLLILFVGMCNQPKCEISRTDKDPTHPIFKYWYTLAKLKVAEVEKEIIIVKSKPRRRI